jgi:hypothetical protein
MKCPGVYILNDFELWAEQLIEVPGTRGLGSSPGLRPILGRCGRRGIREPTFDGLGVEVPSDISRLFPKSRRHLIIGNIRDRTAAYVQQKYVVQCFL